MSYDLEVYTRKVYHRDGYTFNVSNMYVEAYEQIKETAKPYIDKMWYDPVTWKDVLNDEREVSLPVLNLMILELKANPDKYKKMNPSNKWGDYEGAIEFLEDAYIQLKKNKDSRILIST